MAVPRTQKDLDAPRKPNGKDRLGTTVKVKNFGPIAKGEIDLRPLTVFVGPSNTGKSWLAVLIHALQKQFDAPVGQSSDDDEDMRAWLAARSSGGKAPIPPGIPKRIATRAFLSMPTYLREQLGIGDPGTLVRENTTEAKIGLSTGNEAAKIFWKFPDGNDWPDLYGRLKIRKGVARRFQDEILSRRNPELRALLAKKPSLEYLASMPDGTTTPWESALWEAIPTLLDDIRGPLAKARIFYLPAGRTGLMNTYQTIIRSFIREASKVKQQDPLDISDLTGVMGGFIAHIFSLGKLHSEQKLGELDQKLAQSVEKNILKGKITIGDINPFFPYFFYTPDRWKRPMPLMHASSMVSELAPVVLYLRYLVAPGDILILEEPESHLHPEAQVKLIDEVAKWVNAGVRVVLTSHSEWLLEAITNVIDQEKLSKGKSHDSPAIAEDSVGVWRFEQQERTQGTIIRELPLDPETGLYDTGYEDVADDLHNKWAANYSAIRNAKGQ